MKKTAYSAILLMALLAIAASCRNERKDPTADEAHKLYGKICRITGQYTDSIRVAPDSATVYALIERYDEMMEAVNYESLPDTDYDMTEGENDTIAKAMEALIAARAERLKQLGAPKPQPADSVAAGVKE